MYNRYRRPCCKKQYNSNVIETICNNVGTCAEYEDTSDCGCENNSLANSGCGFNEETSAFPENPMLAQSYVPIQQMENTFTPRCGLKMGTIFPELVSPYMPGQSMTENAYLSSTNGMGVRY